MAQGITVQVEPSQTGSAHVVHKQSMSATASSNSSGDWSNAACRHAASADAHCALAKTVSTFWQPVSQAGGAAKSSHAPPAAASAVAHTRHAPGCC